MPDEVGDPELRGELLGLLELDQAVRGGPLPSGVTDAELSDIDAVDRANRERLAEIFEQHGWPGWRLVGEDGSTAAWAIVQHADLDLELQEQGLELLQAAVGEADASPGDLAYLTDRVLVAKGQPQVYGTQWELDAGRDWQPRTPIEDEEDVDARRSEVGLGTLEEYLQELASFDD